MTVGSCVAEAGRVSAGKHPGIELVSAPESWNGVKWPCVVPPATSDLVKGSLLQVGRLRSREWKCLPGFSVSGLRRVSVL